MTKRCERGQLNHECVDCLDWEQTGGEEMNQIYEQCKLKNNIEESKTNLAIRLMMVLDMIMACRRSLRKFGSHQGGYCVSKIADFMEHFLELEIDKIIDEIEVL